MCNRPIDIAFSPDGLLSGNGHRDANLRQAKALMGTRIVKILDEAGLSVRHAELHTGVSHVEFSHIRQAKLRRFTLDRLMAILESLGQDVEISVTVHSRMAQEVAPAL
jgi:predicted XRE-type DNA-binding protein